MAENESQGITRRDLLKRGAALGGAVVWATPVVQTLGMGRAFAQVPSPPVNGGGKDISYMVITWTCEGEEGPEQFHTKLNKNGTPEPGATPDCEMSLTDSTPAELPDWVTNVGAASGACVTVTVDASELDGGCTLGTILLKAGSGTGACQSQPLTDGANSYCTV